MAISTLISQAELARLAAAAYEGLPYRVCLALNDTQQLTVNSSVAAWDGAELSGSGYARVTGFIDQGEYNQTSARYEMPRITAEFRAQGGELIYNTVYLVIDDGYQETLHSIIVESTDVTLVDGASVIYRITLITDD
jgi:hypothetical protein